MLSVDDADDKLVDDVGEAIRLIVVSVLWDSTEIDSRVDGLNAAVNKRIDERVRAILAETLRETARVLPI